MRTAHLVSCAAVFTAITPFSCGTEGPAPYLGMASGIMEGGEPDGPEDDVISPPQTTSSDDAEVLSARKTGYGVGGAGIDLVFPFAADNGCVLTRAYCAAANPWPTDLDENGVSTCTHRANARFNDTYALDFANANDPVAVVAAAAGTVASTRTEQANWGNRVLIDHGNGLYSLYGHLESIDVSEGQRVRQGQRLGSMGNTGNSSGRHVHFAFMRAPGPDGPFEAVLPEPLSGYTDFHTHGRRVYGVDVAYPNLPVGTLIRSRDMPEIFMVCGDMEKCHIEDWQAFASRRFFLDARDPTAQIVNLPEVALDCYADGPPVQGVSVRALIRCGDGDHLYISEGGMSVRRRIPFDRDIRPYHYDAVLRSWGFSRNEWREGSYVECHARTGGDLRLRDGTLIELPSDDDFYVVTADRYENEADQGNGHGYVRRIRREQDGVPLLAALYRTYNNVLMVPGDAVYTMTSGATHDKSVFDAAMAAECRCGTVASGGAGIMYGTSTDPPHTIRCEAGDGVLRIRVTGPVLDALIAVPSDPAVLEYGSDTDGWTVPYPAGTKPSVPWDGDGSYELTLPPMTTRFNLYVADSASATRDSWFDLDESMDGSVPWSIAGDCRREGTVIVRAADGAAPGDADVSPSEETGPPANGGDEDTAGEEVGIAHVISCVRTDEALVVAIRGPILDALHGGTVADPWSLQYGSNVPYLWDLPYDATTGRALAPWEGDGVTYMLHLPRNADGINFFVTGASGGGRWFDLDAQDGDGVPWNVTGDCIRDGTLIRNVGR